MTRKKENTTPAPICQFCNKPINGIPLVTLQMYCPWYHSDKREGEEVILHAQSCPTKFTAKRMEEKNFMRAGDHSRILQYAGIKMEKILTKVSKGYIHYVWWAPTWAVEFVKISQRLDNDSRHAALHMCAKLNDTEKQQLFSGMVRLSGQKGLHLLLLNQKEDICCERGKKLLKRLEKENPNDN